MARPKGTKNKNASEVPRYTSLTTQERVILLANLIIDQIVSDQESGAKLLKKIGNSDVS